MNKKIKTEQHEPHQKRGMMLWTSNLILLSCIAHVINIIRETHKKP